MDDVFTWRLPVAVQMARRTWGTPWIQSAGGLSLCAGISLASYGERLNGGVRLVVIRLTLAVLTAGLANYVTGEQLAADRLAAGEQRLLAIEVMLPERGSTWVVPGVRCRSRTEVLVQRNVQTVKVVDVHASEAELNYVRDANRRIVTLHPGFVDACTPWDGVSVVDWDASATDGLAEIARR